MVAESHLSLNPLTMVYKPYTKITAVCYTNNNVIFHVESEEYQYFLKYFWWTTDDKHLEYRSDEYHLYSKNIMIFNKIFFLPFRATGCAKSHT